MKTTIKDLYKILLIHNRKNKFSVSTRLHTEVAKLNILVNLFNKSEFEINLMNQYFIGDNIIIKQLIEEVK